MRIDKKNISTNYTFHPPVGAMNFHIYKPLKLGNVLTMQRLHGGLEYLALAESIYCLPFTFQEGECDNINGFVNKTNE